MNDYIKVAAVATIAVVVCYLLVRWRAGNGLLTRIFSVVMPTIGITGYITFIMGKQGITTITLTLTSLVGVSTVFVMIFFIQRAVVVKVRSEAEAVVAVASGLNATSQETAASAEEQASAVSQVSSSIEEIHRMSRTTAESSQEVVTAAASAENHGRSGMDSVKEVLHVMERFAQSTSFVEVVSHVAEQSNLLAVNAGIEASKAGEYGRGFAVVATEVRSLAEQSKTAAKQIREAINETKVGQKAISATDEVITKLAQVLRETSDKARQISGAALQQSAGIKQISDAMTNLTQGGKNTALAAQQIRRSGDDLMKVSHRLTLLISGQTDLSKIELGRGR